MGINVRFWFHKCCCFTVCVCVLVSSDFRSIQQNETQPARPLGNNKFFRRNAIVCIGPRGFYILASMVMVTAIFQIYFINRFESINFNLHENAFGKSPLICEIRTHSPTPKTSFSTEYKRRKARAFFSMWLIYFNECIELTEVAFFVTINFHINTSPKQAAR